MSELEVKRAPVKLGKGELLGYYEKEIKRVEIAIEETVKKLEDLQSSRVILVNRLFRTGELNYAISVGHMYLESLNKKIQQLK